MERFFTNSLWYGFTGTPIFEDNKYEQKGDLPQTTEQLYGPCLHSYTIKEAIHDEAVLGFMVENLGKEGLSEEEEEKLYDTEGHMRNVLNVILNHSYNKLGMQNGRGRSYEAILTVRSIAIAQKYYELLTKVKNGEDELKIGESTLKALPDFPRFAITYSLSENEESSQVNQDKMRQSLDDYNAMFGTKYGIENIGAYNGNLNDRLARKEKKYLAREQQLDLVIVVDRLLTGFDAPCLSTLFIDRQPMAPQNIIQAFSRTNRLFDKEKQYGQVVTFQAHEKFKKAINEALALYSRGGTGNPVAEDWETIRDLFAIDLKAMRGLAPTPAEAAGLSREQKKAFVHLFRALDKSFAHLKAFSVYDPVILKQWNFSEEEYEDYAAVYKNVMEELKPEKEDGQTEDDPIRDDYELKAYSKLRVDFEYIVDLLQGFVDTLDPEAKGYDEADFAFNISALREIISEFAQTNPKLSVLLSKIVDEIEQNKEKYIKQDISVIINDMRYSAIDKVIREFAEKWCLDFEEVRYEAFNFKNGELANENQLKEHADYTAYCEKHGNDIKKFKFRTELIRDFKEVMMPEILPLMD